MDQNNAGAGSLCLSRLQGFYCGADSHSAPVLFACEVESGDIYWYQKPGKKKVPVLDERGKPKWDRRGRRLMKEVIITGGWKLQTRGPESF